MEMINDKTNVAVTYAELEQVLDTCASMLLPPIMSMATLTKEYNLVKKCKADGSINPFWSQKDSLRKYTNRRVILLTKYGKRVGSNSEKEGIEEEFEVGQLIGKKHIEGSDVILTDTATETKRYVMIEWFKEVAMKPSVYKVGDTEIDKELLRKYLSYSKPKADSQNGLKRRVNCQTIGFGSIIHLKVNGTTYQVIHP